MCSFQTRRPVSFPLSCGSPPLFTTSLCPGSAIKAGVPLSPVGSAPMITWKRRTPPSCPAPPQSHTGHIFHSAYSVSLPHTLMLLLPPSPTPLLLVSVSGAALSKPAAAECFISQSPWQLVYSLTPRPLSLHSHKSATRLCVLLHHDTGQGHSVFSVSLCSQISESCWNHR